MRLGVAWETTNNAFYRAVHPMQAMERRGHEVVWQSGEDAEAQLRRLSSCDVVHVYRRANQVARRVLAELIREGVGITYDNDDDFTAVPKQSPHYKSTGGLMGQRVFAETVKAACLSRTFTTTTDWLAERYRRAGVERIEVIANHLNPEADRSRRPHEGVVIGWIAGREHRVDADRIRIADALRRLISRYDDVRVECVGINLGLTERYKHDAWVAFDQLPGRIGAFDIGIAPLTDIPWNRARSDIKIKEYAASGVPWLASPVGPYLDHGEAQGGRLVADDGWFEALERLVTQPRERERLGRDAQAWARSQTIDAVADRWEAVFSAAAGQVPGRVSISGRRCY